MTMDSWQATSGRGYQLHKQIELTDGENLLALVVETNGAAWKLFAKFKGEVSDHWSFTSRERAETALAMKVEEAEEQGWMRADN